MAIQETRTLPAPFIETLGQDLAKQLPALTGQALDTSKFAPSVAPQDALQTQAATMAGTSGQGIGAFSPYLTAAQGYTGPTAPLRKPNIPPSPPPFPKPPLRFLVIETIDAFKSLAISKVLTNESLTNFKFFLRIFSVFFDPKKFV